MNVLAKIKEEFRKNGFSLAAFCTSPVKGGSGNIEYLAVLKNSDVSDAAVDFQALVAEAFSQK